jgi:hypothetical protein
MNVLYHNLQQTSSHFPSTEYGYTPFHPFHPLVVFLELGAIANRPGVYPDGHGFTPVIPVPAFFPVPGITAQLIAFWLIRALTDAYFRLDTIGVRFRPDFTSSPATWAESFPTT